MTTNMTQETIDFITKVLRIHETDLDKVLVEHAEIEQATEVHIRGEKRKVEKAFEELALEREK